MRLLDWFAPSIPDTGDIDMERPEWTVEELRALDPRNPDTKPIVDD